MTNPFAKKLLMDKMTEYQMKRESRMNNLSRRKQQILNTLVEPIHSAITRGSGLN